LYLSQKSLIIVYSATERNAIGFHWFITGYLLLSRRSILHNNYKPIPLLIPLVRGPFMSSINGGPGWICTSDLSIMSRLLYILRILTELRALLLNKYITS